MRKIIVLVINEEDIIDFKCLIDGIGSVHIECIIDDVIEDEKRENI